MLKLSRLVNYNKKRTNNSQTSKMQKTKEELIWNKHWKDFYSTFDPILPFSSIDIYADEKNYFISMFNYYFYLNRSNDFKPKYKTMQEHIKEALNSIFVIFYNNGYQIKRNLIIYAWISQWKEAIDILSNDPKYKKNIPKYHAMQVDIKQFSSILCDCKTKDQAVQLLKSYKFRYNVERLLNNECLGPRERISLFCDFIFQNKPDFILEAFITAGWDVNEIGIVESRESWESALCVAFHAQRYKIVRLLLKAGATRKVYNYSSSKDIHESMPYFHSFETFNKLCKTSKDYLDFAIYAEYVSKLQIKKKEKIFNKKYVQNALQWLIRIRLFECMVSRRRIKNIFSILNKDIISIIRGYVIEIPI